MDAAPAMHDPIAIALAEDIGSGDITTSHFVAAGLQSFGRIVARERAIMAGIEIAAEVFRRVDSTLHVQVLQPDGSALLGGESVLEIRGDARSILTAERVALNFLQHLSGIATLTRQFVEAAANDAVKILDTRKTTPGLRAYEKAAVVAGGGANHRLGLFDMVLVKDNHLATGNGFANLERAVQKVRAAHPDVRVVLEADSLEQVREFLRIEGVDWILLDNMKPSTMREAVSLGNGKIKFEASGGVSLKTVRRIAATGVDFISVGAITHSARAIDFSLEMTNVSG